MGGQEENRFHRLLVLTERPGRWPAWLMAPVGLALAATAGAFWSGVTAVPATGWALASGLLAFAIADWASLAMLPRHGISFGAVQPPWLALLIVRFLLAMVALPLAARWAWLAWAIWATVQLLVSVLMLYGTLVEPFRLQTSHVEIENRFSNPGSPMSLVQLSDLHVERLTRREKALPALVSDLAPDLILLTGDYLSTSYNSDPRALSELRRLLEQLQAPGGVYAIWGTPEVDFPSVLRPVLSEQGIIVLEDQAVEITHGGHRLWLMGISCTRDLDSAAATLDRLLVAAPPQAFKILLFHSPDLTPHAAGRGVDLVLSGHTHGGQWRLPGLGAIVTSSRYWKRYEAGHYREDGTHLYVSRGLGMEGFGAPRARFFCPPEVVSIRLIGAGDED